MSGLTTEGFVPLTYQEIKDRISARLEVFSPGIDLTTESPDGQLVEIFSFELGQAWNELNLVYNSYNPNIATGAGLRNIGLITGLPFGAATRSQANVELTGTAGTLIPVGSIVTDALGNQFTTAFEAELPATVQVYATLSGEISMLAGTITTILTPVTGWTGVAQATAGQSGTVVQTEVAYRNTRNNTVLRNYRAVEETIRARLLEQLSISQVVVLNNDTAGTPLSDGTPAQTIHVTVGEVPVAATDDLIASVILSTKGLGCPTFGSTTVAGVLDTQGNTHSVSFSKATAESIYFDIEVTFLDSNTAGAIEAIKADLLTHINGLATDEDVVWSRLFSIITPYAKAQVDKLEISVDDVTYNAANIVITADKFANTETAFISVVETP